MCQMFSPARAGCTDCLSADDLKCGDLGVCVCVAGCAGNEADVLDGGGGPMASPVMGARSPLSLSPTTTDGQPPAATTLVPYFW